MDAGGLLWLVIDVAMVAALAGALIYGIIQWRRRSRRDIIAGERATKQMYKGSEEVRDSDVTLAPADRITEDDAAQAVLGGSRGATELKPAKMTPQREKKTPHALDPGHTA